MSNDDLLKQGIDHLKRFELKDAESCFTEVLDNDSENDTAKKGMMLQSLYTGFEQLKVLSPAFLEIRSSMTRMSTEKGSLSYRINLLMQLK